MGVKSLWTLLTPVGRPVMLETVEGKIMAIDSSIWIYQFQATMRDKEGRGLVNAHVLGFLRRIAKLLFYGIKPVFVFDGGAPTLKRSTLNERRKKKSGAAVSHVKLAEKLLAAQLRREALNYTGKGKAPVTNEVAHEDMVYLEDLEPGAPTTPPRRKPPTPSSSTKKQHKFHDHDPYKLPEVDLEAVVSKITHTKPAYADPRLATEDELRSFIEDMRPEDFDVNSPAFRELPTEVQYEIIGDLRLKSRQTSFVRLQKMLSTSRTPLDFSKQQIENLRQRNALTQQLLVTTDSIGSAHISIPVRIASERNKEYVLIKNDDGSGGWILGVRDPTGSRDKPIEIDQDPVEKFDVDEDEDEDMEEVDIPAIPTIPTYDPDLREWQRENAIGAISNRNTDKGLAPLTTKEVINRRPKLNPKPLFDMDEDDISDEEAFDIRHADAEQEDEDMLAIAIQQSLDDARAESRHAPSGGPIASSSSVTLDSDSHSSLPQTPERGNKKQVTYLPDDDDGDMYVTPNRLQAALRFARPSHSNSNSPSMFGRSTLLSKPSPPKAVSRVQTGVDEVMEAHPSTSSAVKEVSASIPVPAISDTTPPETETATLEPFTSGTDSSDEEMEEIRPPSPVVLQHTIQERQVDAPDHAAGENVPSHPAPATGSVQITPTIPLFIPTGLLPPKPKPTTPPPTTVLTAFKLPSPRPDNAADDSDDDMEEVEFSAPAQTKPSPSNQPHPELLFVPLSRSPSPSRPSTPHDHPHDEPNQDHEDAEAHREEHEQEYDEADLQAEEGEFAKFVSQVKGRDLHQVRKEIDEEIATLNQQRKNALRDSEDVNQQMINQIMTMLRLFGIPYITAPMEAEAQCAELVSLGLVDGVITDDSDVFLFGAARVFKNMFNQSKTVECFLLADLEKELGLSQDTLIQLAYLLGSDYTEGLAGVGPVVAMELIREFPGKDGLWKFKEWWLKVQSGKDTEKESGTKFKRMFKKKFKDLFIAQDWPNTVVRDAYYHPTVDSSKEPFKWGLPDLDGLRGFFQDELDWSKAKVDDLLLPIVQKMNKRTQAKALNKQGNLNEFMGVSGMAGTLAPRQRQAYASKRLQQVVSDFRKKRARSASEGREKSVASGGAGEGEGESTEPAPKKKRRAPSTAVGGTKKRKQATTTKASGGAKKAGKGKAKARRRVQDEESGAESGEEGQDSDDEFSTGAGGAVNIEVPLNVEFRPRPKPRPIVRPPPGEDAE